MNDLEKQVELVKELEAARRLVGHPIRLSIGGPTKTVKEAYLLLPENSRNLAVFLDFTDDSFCLYSDFLYGAKLPAYTWRELTFNRKTNHAN